MSFQINQLKESFQQNGYVVVPNFLDTNELRTVQKNIERLIEITHQNVIMSMLFMPTSTTKAH